MYDNFGFMGSSNANLVMRIKTCGKQASLHFVQIPMECGLQCKGEKKRVKEQHFRTGSSTLSLDLEKGPLNVQHAVLNSLKRSGYPTVKVWSIFHLSK